MRLCDVPCFKLADGPGASRGSRFGSATTFTFSIAAPGLDFKVTARLVNALTQVMEEQMAEPAGDGGQSVRGLPECLTVLILIGLVRESGAARPVI
jgi:hypothetical protein